MSEISLSTASTTHADQESSKPFDCEEKLLSIRNVSPPLTKKVSNDIKSKKNFHDNKRKVRLPSKEEKSTFHDKPQKMKKSEENKLMHRKRINETEADQDELQIINIDDENIKKTSHGSRCKEIIQVNISSDSTRSAIVLSKAFGDASQSGNQTHDAGIVMVSGSNNFNSEEEEKHVTEEKISEANGQIKEKDCEELSPERERRTAEKAPTERKNDSRRRTSQRKSEERTHDKERKTAEPRRRNSESRYPSRSKNENFRDARSHRRSPPRRNFNNQRFGDRRRSFPDHSIGRSRGRGFNRRGGDFRGGDTRSNFHRQYRERSPAKSRREPSGDSTFKRKTESREEKSDRNKPHQDKADKGKDGSLKNISKEEREKLKEELKQVDMMIKMKSQKKTSNDIDDPIHASEMKPQKPVVESTAINSAIHSGEPSTAGMLDTADSTSDQVFEIKIDQEEGQGNQAVQMKFAHDVNSRQSSDADEEERCRQMEKPNLSDSNIAQPFSSSKPASNQADINSEKMRSTDSDYESKTEKEKSPDVADEDDKHEESDKHGNGPESANISGNEVSSENESNVSSIGSDEKDEEESESESENSDSSVDRSTAKKKKTKKKKKRTSDSDSSSEESDSSEKSSRKKHKKNKKKKKYKKKKRKHKKKKKGPKQIVIKQNQLSEWLEKQKQKIHDEILSDMQKKYVLTESAAATPEPVGDKKDVEMSPEISENAAVVKNEHGYLTGVTAQKNKDESESKCSEEVVLPVEGEEFELYKSDFDLDYDLDDKTDDDNWKRKSSQKDKVHALEVEKHADTTKRNERRINKNRNDREKDEYRRKSEKHHRTNEPGNHRRSSHQPSTEKVSREKVIDESGEGREKNSSKKLEKIDVEGDISRLKDNNTAQSSKRSGEVKKAERKPERHRRDHDSDRKRKKDDTGKTEKKDEIVEDNSRLLASSDKQDSEVRVNKFHQKECDHEKKRSKEDDLESDSRKSVVEIDLQQNVSPPHERKFSSGRFNNSSAQLEIGETKSNSTSDGIAVANRVRDDVYKKNDFWKADPHRKRLTDNVFSEKGKVRKNQDPLDETTEAIGHWEAPYSNIQSKLLKLANDPDLRIQQSLSVKEEVMSNRQEPAMKSDAEVPEEKKSDSNHVRKRSHSDERSARSSADVVKEPDNKRSSRTGNSATSSDQRHAKTDERDNEKKPFSRPDKTISEHGARERQKSDDKLERLHRHSPRERDHQHSSKERNSRDSRHAERNRSSDKNRSRASTRTHSDSTSDVRHKSLNTDTNKSRYSREELRRSSTKKVRGESSSVARQEQLRSDSETHSNSLDTPPSNTSNFTRPEKNYRGTKRT